MGAVCCKPEDDDLADPAFGSARVKSWKRHKWRSEEPLTRAQLQRMREEFWETEPHYGGDRVIWDALKGACEADLETARTILDSAGVFVAAADMSICYDERGRKQDGGGAAGAGGQLELPAVAAGAGGAAGSGAGAGARGVGTGSPSSPDSAHLPEDAPLNQVAVR
ncbi:hypothetical protein ABPG75_000366 [Micractinium tetrahymenae]